MERTYKPEKVESAIYKKWEKSGFFSPKVKKRNKPFTIIMPPPNANAQLHVGHAMFITIEDILIRYYRMKGYNTLWLPGADHAGILTQVVFERHLEKKGGTRYDLGREEFYKQCLAFTQKNKKLMYNQMKKLGASCDWSREKFTLDKDVSKVVFETFVKLYQDGLIYRDWRMINWCTRCMTALSDLEVEWIEQKDPLYFIKYGPIERSKIKDQRSKPQRKTQNYLTVATTRPETMFGDVAVATHPQDKRYKSFIGNKINLPLVDKKIPIITDNVVDPQFGTGVVKVTPAHDFTDFEIGKRHNLEVKRVIEFDGKLNKKTGKYAGLPVNKARDIVIQDLKEKGLLVKVNKKYKHRVSRCERCKTIIEPMVSLQWFINVNAKCKVQSAKLFGKEKISLKELGILAIKKGLIKILPERFEKTYFQWMENLEDWCISRQLWWGHRMPVWYCGTKGLSDLQKSMNPRLTKGKKKGCGKTIVQLTKPTICTECPNTDIIQDPDTFDTWFSSSQWPYTTLGFNWNGRCSKDYEYFYPTSVMETGYEILFFWVARMIMMGLYSAGDIPFKIVYLHGLVRDAFGEKMSKSKGNVIDPLDVINKYGADALRLALVWGIAPGSDSTIGDEKIKGMRNFANKLWNIGRFMMLYLDKLDDKSIITKFNSKKMKLAVDDRKILVELNKVIHISTKKMDEYRLSDVAQYIYNFTWHKLADKYVESVKTRLQNLSAKDQHSFPYQDGLVALSVLGHAYINVLKLLHPFMPFVTEEIWSKIPETGDKPLIGSSWPKESS